MAKMLKKITLAFLTVLVLVTGCDDVEDLLTFHFDDHTQIRIESTSPLSLPLEVATPAVTSNSQQQYDNHNTRADLVRDVRLEQLKLTIEAPEAKTFSFLKSIHIYISSSEAEEIELASLDNIASTASALELVPTDRKLDAYAKSPSYTLRTEVVTDETLTHDVDVRVDLKFRVTADTF